MKNHTIIVFFSSIFLGAVGAWFMANYGPKIGFVDRPNERSSHQSSTPKGGGIGILAGFVMASLVLNIPAGFELPPELLFWACLFALFGYLMYGSLMAGLGALAPDIKDTRSAAFIVLSPFIVAYMFMIVFIEAPNGPLAIILSLFPLTSPVVMITRMTVTAVPTWQSALAAVLQLIGAIVIIRMVAQLFRAQALLSGQSFSIKGYFNALLGRA